VWFDAVSVFFGACTSKFAGAGLLLVCILP
jgi:hypothetical protein